MTVIDGKTAVEKMMITFPDDLYDQEKQVQPNGIDLRVHRIFLIVGRASLPEAGKMDFSDMQITQLDPKNGWFDLDGKQGHYLVDFRERVVVPENYCGIIVPRSSLLRAGAFMTSALWDSNFEGRTGGALRILNPIRIQYGARLGQMIFIKAEYNGGAGYQGRYQGGDSQVGFLTEG